MKITDQNDINLINEMIERSNKKTIFLSMSKEFQLCKRLDELAKKYNLNSGSSYAVLVINSDGFEAVAYEEDAIEAGNDYVVIEAECFQYCK